MAVPVERHGLPVVRGSAAVAKECRKNSSSLGGSSSAIAFCRFSHEQEPMKSIGKRGLWLLIYQRLKDLGFLGMLCDEATNFH